jgi:hypothetical protein
MRNNSDHQAIKTQQIQSLCTPKQQARWGIPRHKFTCGCAMTGTVAARRPTSSCTLLPKNNNPPGGISTTSYLRAYMRTPIIQREKKASAP